MAQLVVDMFNRYYKDYRDQDASEDAAQIDGILGLFGRLGVRHHTPQVSATTVLCDLCLSLLIPCCCLGYAGKHPERANDADKARHKAQTKIAGSQHATGK